MSRTPLLLAAVGLGSATAIAGDTLAQSANPPTPRCDAPEHRQFDFWVGQWVVTAGGQPAGRNRIDKILEGCALLESWTGVGGSSGNSLNFYDSTRGLWHQTWISGTGFALGLDGRFADGKMTLAGPGVDPETRAAVTHRITWTALPSGEVRQLWESSPDGKTWQVLFDGLYTRER